MKSPFRGFSAILYKEFIVVLRDPMTLFFMLFPPLIEMIAFGYALDNDVKHMSTVLLDEDRTVESRQVIDRLVNTETFRVAGEVQSVSELAAFMRRGKACIGVQIPPGFTRLAYSASLSATRPRAMSSFSGTAPRSLVSAIQASRAARSSLSLAAWSGASARL